MANYPLLENEKIMGVARGRDRGEPTWGFVDILLEYTGRLLALSCFLAILNL